MARPTKNGLDYFPTDVNIFYNEKMICIRGEFGLMGEAVALWLICDIYRRGYFTRWTEALTYKMTAELPGLDADTLLRIIDRLTHWELFDATLWQQERVLTSIGIQRRYFEATRRRTTKRDSEKLPYLLDESAENRHATPQPEAPKSKEQTTTTATTTPPQQPATQPSQPQSTDNTDYYNSYDSPDTSAELTARSTPQPPLHWDEDFIEWATTDENQWFFDNCLKQNGITADRFKMIATMVIDEWNQTGVKHERVDDARRHLYNHVAKKLRHDRSLRSCPTPRQQADERAMRQQQRLQAQQADEAYRRSVAETGMNGYQQWCQMRGIDPTQSAAEIAGRLAAAANTPALAS